MIVSTCNVHTKAPQNWWLLTKYHISHRIASDIGNLFRPPGFGSISTYTAVVGVLRKLILAALLYPVIPFLDLDAKNIPGNGFNPNRNK